MHFHNFGSANVVGIHSCTNLQKENIFYPIAGIIDIPNMQHTVLFNIGFGIGDDYWKRPDCTCKILAKGLCMQKWKRGTIICLGINILLLYGLLTDYYEFFIKECRDAFPFNYCPWGGESMGWAWRSADVYLTNLVSSCATLLFFIPVSLYFLYKKNYKVSFWLALSPIIISWTDSLLGALLYHYAKF